MPRILAVLLVLAAVFLASCTDSERAAAPAGDLLAAIKARGSIRLGVKADAPPFGRKLGKDFQGFDIDIAQAVADALGVKAEFVAVTTDNRIQKLAAGDVDLLVATMTITRSREKQVDFSLPYFQDGQGLLVRSDSPVQGYQDLAGRKVGAVKGSTSANTMQQVAPDALIQTYPGYTELIQALVDRKVDAITSDTLLLMGMRLAAKDPAALRLAGDRFSTEPYGIALPQNQSALRDAVNDILQDLWEKGRWQLIYDGCFGPGTRYATTITFAMPIYSR